MINRDASPVEWSQWFYELSDAKEHLEKLITDTDNVDFDEVQLRVQLGHIYAHLNRAWNSRNHLGEIDTSLWKKNSKFPDDISWT